MKVTTARKWYGEGSGIVIKTDDHLIDLYWSTRFMLGTYYCPRTVYGDGKSYIVALGWFRLEITEDDVNYWEYM